MAHPATLPLPRFDPTLFFYFGWVRSLQVVDLSPPLGILRFSFSSPDVKERP